jgi:hypothetical protein
MNLEKRKLKWTSIILLSGVMLSLLIGCEDNKVQQPSVDPDATWSLTTDIQPIFNAKCITCHNGVTNPDLREGKSYNSLTTRGYVTLPAEESKLYKTMVSASHDARSNGTDKLKVLYWITQGAKNN